MFYLEKIEKVNNLFNVYYKTGETEYEIKQQTKEELEKELNLIKQALIKE